MNEFEGNVIYFANLVSFILGYLHLIYTLKMLTVEVKTREGNELPDSQNHLNYTKKLI